MLSRVIPALLVLASLTLTASGAEPAPRTVLLEVRVPDGAWAVVIEEIWEVRGELWAFARVERPAEAMAAMMICTAVDEITAKLPAGELRFFVRGKTWAWANEEKVEWIQPTSEFLRNRREGKRLWRRPRA